MDNEYYYDREQSQVKHRILERYLQAFAPIIGTSPSFDEIVYIDCMAGPWNARDAALSDTSFHKALAVFSDCKRRGRCKRVRALLIEKNAESYSRLDEYARTLTDIEVVTKNWDFTQHVAEIVAFARQSRKAFPFFFIDPTGWSAIRINLIRPILRVDPGEVLITFMSSWVKRFLDDPTKPFEELLGKGVDQLRSLEGDDLEDELVRTYAEEVKRSGNYTWTCAIPILMPDRDAIHFHMVYGTRNFKGLEEFKRTEADAIDRMHELRAKAQQRRAFESKGQAFLLAPEETYREQRFRGFHERRMANAQETVMRLLLAQGSVSYQDLCRDALQYSTVLDDDLKGWLFELAEKKRVTFANMIPRQRTLRPETIVQLVREHS